LLSAITEFPLPSTSPLPGEFARDLTVGPDGNLWFTEYELLSNSIEAGPIGRITPAGAVTEFPLPVASDFAGPLTVGPDGNLWFPASSEVGRVTPSGALTAFPLSTPNSAPGPLTVGPDGNLWFPDRGGPGAIGRFGLRLPHVTRVIAVAPSRKAITSILVAFDEALDPASASEARFYSLASGVEKRHKLVFRKGVKIARVSYGATTQTVRLKLAVPQKGPIQVTVRAGIVAADGVMDSSEYTAVVR
jgi:hypothetical protein